MAIRRIGVLCGLSMMAAKSIFNSQRVSTKAKRRLYSWSDYVVDRLFARAELRLGEKDQQVVRIDRTQS